MDDEEEFEAESPVLTASPLTRWNVLSHLCALTGQNIVNVGIFIGSIGAMLEGHGEAQEERKAFAAAVATEIETLTGE